MPVPHGLLIVLFHYKERDCTQQTAADSDTPHDSNTGRYAVGKVVKLNDSRKAEKQPGRSENSESDSKPVKPPKKPFFCYVNAHASNINTLLIILFSTQLTDQRFRIRRLVTASAGIRAGFCDRYLVSTH